MLILGTFARGIQQLSRAIRDFSNAIFWPPRGDPLKSLDEAFSPIDIEAVKKRLNLVDEAVRFGKHGLPDSGDRKLDGPQERVIHFVQEEVANAFRRANRELQRVRDALEGRDISSLVARAERLPQELTEIIGRQTREANKHIDDAARQRQELEGELSQYRERHQVDRPPRLRDATDRRLLLYGTLMLALLQATANAVFFAQGMPLGLTAGLWFAIVLGIADVALHTMLGKNTSRVRAPDLANRVLGMVLFGVALFTVPFWNLGMVHLRLSIRRFGFADGTEMWWDAVSTDPLGFTDFGSFALLGIGVACSALAVTTGWSWDEPIPFFREAGRKLQNLRMDHDFWEERRVRISYEAKAEAEAELKRIVGQVEHNVQMAQHLVTRIERLQQNLNTFVRDAERACKALIQTYRDENRLARSAPAPQYFMEEPPCKFDNPLDFDLSEIQHFLKRQLRLESRLAQRTQLLHEGIASDSSEERTTVETP